ncbi:retrovirus-related pol polyprotein from transposon TNT 1-94 [Tanacetum coccineum]
MKGLDGRSGRKADGRSGRKADERFGRRTKPDDIGGTTCRIIHQVLLYHHFFQLMIQLQASTKPWHSFAPPSTINSRRRQIQGTKLLCKDDRLRVMGGNCSKGNATGTRVIREKYIDGQLRKVIVDKNAKVADFENQIHSLKQKLNKTIESYKTLSIMVYVLKIESKAKEDKYLDEIIELEKKNKALDNVIYKIAFVPQKQLSTKQAFWLPNSKLVSEIPPVQPESVLKEIPRELPTISLVKDSFNNMRNHVNDFENVVTVRTKVTGQNEGLHKEITDMKEVFNQMETGVANCSVERKCFEIKEKELLLENERLFEHILHQDVMCIALHADVESKYVMPVNDNRLEYAELEKSYIAEYSKVLEREAELVKKKDMIEQDVFIELSKTYSKLEKHCISLKIVVQQYLQSLSPNLRNNVDYIKVTMEHADTLRGIVEQARSLNPLDNALDFALSHDQCVIDYLNDVNARARAKSVKSIKKKKNENLLFMGTVRFNNDQVAAIMGYDDYQIGNVTISRVYYVEGLGHNLFLVGQFCDTDLEVAFRKHSCYVRDLDGVDLLKGLRGSNLYSISLEDMLKSSPICLLSKALNTKSWLWHRCLLHLNFSTINQLAKEGLVKGLPKLKYEKNHMCYAYSLGKSRKYSHKPKVEDSSQEKLYLLHMDLCGPMHERDETSEFVIKFLKKVQGALNATEFVNQTLGSYYENVRITHQTLVARTPQQNDVVERRNQTLVEASRTVLIFSKALLHLHVFGALCYPTKDSEDFGMLKPKVNIGIFVGYSPTKNAYRIYNKKTRIIIETIHVEFDELTVMASEQFNSGPAPQFMTLGYISSGLVQNPSSSTPNVPPSKKY